MKLFLGVVPGIYPWEEEDDISKEMKKNNVGIILSYWSFRKKHKEIISKGLQDFFAFDGDIMLDSGAYSAFNSGVDIKIEDYYKFLSKMNIRKNDVVVTLDVVGNPKKSLKNWEFLKGRCEFSILPVIHLSERGKRYENEDYLGLGGMVPAFKINQKGSVYDVASWLVKLSQIGVKKYHGFGIGSPFHQVIFSDYLHSVDWIGWRRNAAICDCYTPEGSRSISEARKKKSKGRKMTLDLFEKYKPPFINSYDLLHKPGTEGWKYRALWNAWWFIAAKNYKKQMDSSNYIASLRRRMERIKFEASIDL